MDMSIIFLFFIFMDFFIFYRDFFKEEKRHLLLI